MFQSASNFSTDILGKDGYIHRTFTFQLVNQ